MKLAVVLALAVVDHWFRLIAGFMSDAEKAKVEGLETGDTISIKGRTSGISLRNIEIEDAVLTKP